MALFVDPRINYAGSTLFTPDEKAEIQVKTVMYEYLASIKLIL